MTPVVLRDQRRSLIYIYQTLTNISLSAIVITLTSHQFGQVSLYQVQHNHTLCTYGEKKDVNNNLSGSTATSRAIKLEAHSEAQNQGLLPELGAGV